MGDRRGCRGGCGVVAVVPFAVTAVVCAGNVAPCGSEAGEEGCREQPPKRSDERLIQHGFEARDGVFIGQENVAAGREVPLSMSRSILD